MDISTSIKVCFKKYAEFLGRASRSEFWYFFLFYILASFLGGFVIGLATGYIYKKTHSSDFTYGSRYGYRPNY